MSWGIEMPDQFIAYVTHRFPSLRTTFIRREVEALRALGLPFEVVSLRPADRDELVEDGEAARHLATTRYLPGATFGPSSILATARCLLRNPLKSLANWRLGFADAGRPTLEFRLRLWVQVWRGAALAAYLRRLGHCVHVHAQFADGAATTAMAAARLLGVGFSFMSHTSFDSPALLQKIRAARFIACISEYDRQRLVRIGGPEVGQKTHIVRCGIPVHDWPYRPKAAGGSPVQVLSVAALTEKKGHDILVKACALLKARGRRCRCRIVGGGPLAASLRRLVGDLGLSGEVELPGPLPQDRVREELYAADVFALACKQLPNGDVDGIPVSLMEAMATGVPVVSTTTAGVPELIEDGVSGHLARPEDPIAFADALERSLVQLERGNTPCSAARRTIEEHFSLESEAKSLAGLLLKASSAQVSDKAERQPR